MLDYLDKNSRLLMQHLPLTLYGSIDPYHLANGNWFSWVYLHNESNQYRSNLTEFELSPVSYFLALQLSPCILIIFIIITSKALLTYIGFFDIKCQDNHSY